MTTEIWTGVLTESFQSLSDGVLSFAPVFIIALIVFIVGAIISSIVGKFVAKVVDALKVDKALQTVGVDEMMNKAGFSLNAGAFIGGLIKWFLIIVFLVASIDILGLSDVNNFLRDVVLGYLPNVIIAAIILVVAAFLAGAMQKLVTGSARAAGVPSVNILGGLTKWAIWIFAILAALFQLGIAGAFAQTLFTGFVAMVAIAGGLAFGLGGKDAAAKYIEKLKKDIAE
ncbi:TPA: hypothetical protein DEW47_03250 [Patescibacteria group bacterium]|nr:MAG: Small-conductance mechanosensitive ion channel-like protein [Parcubacteria group bacterium GW2011_GWF2_40_10]KKR48020.1 MAG: Small-conductance mechanosensitive ion channel-like protein [Parcubacteria group bacterium GW2011_GWA2_40_143]KKR60500.1 MAG: Small-conductance mechanosensitive ion channel-like protein [Parcubacteria group bacterium GW2011_GWC2_40_31]KKR76142.1 MAG: Small-conductance mechanosensitive ion channel-like protein [Parcubacteria group bacterium GW2011_GWE2_40_8]HBB5676